MHATAAICAVMAISATEAIWAVMAIPARSAMYCGEGISWIFY
jgi:hypothetical protein